MPVVLSLDVSAFFSLLDDSGNTTDTHTPIQVLSAMKEATLTDFIQNYIWESEPVGKNIFYETMHVQVQPDGIEEEEETSLSNALHTVNTADKAVVHVALSYSFHDTATVSLREPGPEEIDGLINKTADFFSHMIYDELPDSSTIDKIKLVATSVEYKELSEFSVVVYSRLEVDFKANEFGQRPTAEQVLAIRKFPFSWTSAPCCSASNHAMSIHHMHS